MSYREFTKMCAHCKNIKLAKGEGKQTEARENLHSTGKYSACFI